MNTSFFIAKKIFNDNKKGRNETSPIIKLAVFSISLALAVNIITFAVVIGFKNEVSNKILGFGSHAFVSSTQSTSLFENEPILKNQALLADIKKMSFVRNVNAVAFKPAILQSHKINSKSQEIQSVLIKGVEENFDFDFFKSYLKEGTMPNYQSFNASNEVLISKWIANSLSFKVGDTINVFFVKNEAVKRKLICKGIYDTGMEEMDKKILIADIKLIQQMNDWGISSEIEILDTTYNKQLIIKGKVKGGNGHYRYNWGNGYTSYSGFTFFPVKDTVFRLISSDYFTLLNESTSRNTLPDTSYLKLKIKGYPIGSYKKNADNTLDIYYHDDKALKGKIFDEDAFISFEKTPGKGSFSNYIGAYEIQFNSWKNFDENINQLKKMIRFSYSDEFQDIHLTSLKENEREIFVWLDFLDINVYVIITLMLIIGIINMGSALLVLIISNTSSIGLFMALGMKNTAIKKIFMYRILFLLLKGLFYGNLVAIVFYFSQKWWGILSLNPEVYYLNKVPVELSFWLWLIINILSIFVCWLALWIPTFVISKISPSKNLRFS
ncbi:MAG: ABC transporter permease [Flavobacteriia bacterium]|nr:ABC transporter permease [Flavobacteriia bacterium]